MRHLLDWGAIKVGLPPNSLPPVLLKTGGFGEPA
jgi:hypothetical protein